MTEKCPTCNEPLGPVVIGWIDIDFQRRSDGLHIRFYGKFSEFDKPYGFVFGWIEYPEQIPEGLFCERGHIGLSKEGRIVR